jgi:hypothetical protein
MSQLDARLTMSSKIAGRFSYPSQGIKLYGAFFLSVWLLSCIAIPFWRRDGWFGAEVFLLNGFTLVGIFYLDACFTDSDVEIGQDEITWVLFGWRWKSIRWKDVTRVRVLSTWDFRYREFTKMYCIDPSDKPRPYFLKDGGMSLGDTLIGVEDIEKMINTKIRDFHIPTKLL